MQDLQVLKFDKINVPLPWESIQKRDDTYVWYGTNNLYPNFLLSLYNNSPIHSSILNAKANYIIGDGLKVNEQPLNLRLNAADKIDEFINKIVRDYLLFNFFAVEVVYNVFNKPIEYHFVPAHKVRCNKSKTKFWVNEDWKLNCRPIIYDRYKPNSKDSKSKIFFFDGYNPSENNVYTTPEYSGSIKAIQNDIEIRNFNLNNIRNNFSVSTIITFFRGSNVSDEIKEKVFKDLKESYTGSEGRRMIIDFQDPSQPSADVKNISANDWDKAYQEVAKQVANDIYIGHQVTSPMLFGVKTEGQLGGSTELETAYEIFKNTYIRNKRNELTEALNMLFAEFEAINGQVEFVDKQLFSARISEDLKEKIFTINELRKEAGMPPIPSGNKLLGEVPHVTDSINPPNPIPKKFNADEIFHHLTEEDFEKIKDLGTVSDEFEFIEEGMSAQAFADKIAPLPNLIETRYKYQVRPGLGEPIIPTSRPFCVKMIENNRLYTREEIQTMSAIFGYDMFKLAGGFYTNPETDVTTPYCRHYFQQRTVIKKI